MSTTREKAQEAATPEEIDAPALDKDEAKQVKDQFVAFNGHNGVRIIDAEDWKGLGIDCETKVWDRRNAWRLPASEFDAKALNYLLKVDGEFVAED